MELLKNISAAIAKRPWLISVALIVLLPVLRLVEAIGRLVFLPDYYDSFGEALTREMWFTDWWWLYTSTNYGWWMSRFLFVWLAVTPTALLWSLLSDMHRAFLVPVSFLVAVVVCLCLPSLKFDKPDTAVNQDWLLWRLRSHDPEVRVKFLALLGADKTRRLPPITNAIVREMLVKDEVANVRGFAAHVLIFHPSTEAIPELTIALKDNTAGVRGLAANALLELGPEARNVLPTLQELMKDSDPWVRANAAGAYIVVGGDVDVGLPVLEASATEKAPHPRWAAGIALARVGQRYPQRVTPALSKLLNDPDPEVRHQTTVAVDLAELKTEGLVPALVVNLKDENFAVRKSAVRTLRRIGLGDDAALAILGTMSRNDPDGGVQDEAKHALETLLTARRTKAKAAP